MAAAAQLSPVYAVVHPMSEDQCFHWSLTPAGNSFEQGLTRTYKMPSMAIDTLSRVMAL